MKVTLDIEGRQLIGSERPVFTEFEGELREGQSPPYEIDVPERAPWSVYIANKSDNDSGVLTIDFQDSEGASQQIDKVQPGSSYLVPVTRTATQFVITNPLPDEKVPVTILVF